MRHLEGSTLPQGINQHWQDRVRRPSPSCPIGRDGGKSLALLPSKMPRLWAISPGLSVHPVLQLVKSKLFINNNYCYLRTTLSCTHQAIPQMTHWPRFTAAAVQAQAGTSHHSAPTCPGAEFSDGSSPSKPFNHTAETNTNHEGKV